VDKKDENVFWKQCAKISSDFLYPVSVLLSGASGKAYTALISACLRLGRGPARLRSQWINRWWRVNGSIGREPFTSTHLSVASMWLYRPQVPFSMSPVWHAREANPAYQFWLCGFNKHHYLAGHYFSNLR